MRTLTAMALILATATATPALAEAAKMLPPVLTEQTQDQVLSNQYIGTEIVARAPEGMESVGEVSDLLLDRDDKLIGVIVDVGGFLGIGEKPVGLSWASLTKQMKDGEMMLVTDLTKAELEEAPEFKSLSAKGMNADDALIDAEQAPMSSTSQ